MLGHAHLDRPHAHEEFRLGNVVDDHELIAADAVDPAGKDQAQQEEQKNVDAGNEKEASEEEEFLDEGMDFDEELENEIHRLMKDEDETEGDGQG